MASWLLATAAVKEAKRQNPVLTNSERVVRSKNNSVNCFNDVKDMRHSYLDKQAHHCNVQSTKPSFYSRCRRDWMKEKAFTGGGLGIDSVSMRQEVSRSHSNWW